ncbi:MAG TPA: isoprenylcysteine carboxylmethyltransferase family protein, partial [bacterium]|nr:isoprenylcysteine carboxylmethyltransferase family protein [bacterium]
VRHPLYAGAFLLLAGQPLALGSLWGLIPVAGLFAVIVARLLEEEKFLAKKLPGYKAYCRQVRHRLVPGIW